MEKVNRQKLEDFLRENGCKRTKTVMRVLEPFFRIAEKGVYELAPKEKIDPEKVKGAIANATGKEVKKVIFISVNDPVPKPEWMADGACQGSLKKCLRAGLWPSIWNSLVDDLAASFVDSFAANLEDSLREGLGYLGTCLGDSLKDSLRYSFKDSLGDNLMYDLERILEVSLLYYIRFSIANKQEEITRLEPLIKLLSKCLILGNKKDEPGAWLVLVK